MNKIVFKDYINDLISETLLITLYMRHLDSIKQEPILNDKFASEIYSKIDYDFSKFDKANLTKVGTVIRAKYFDDEIVDFCKNNPKVVVVQLGAGLDTRVLRLQNKCQNAIFYDLDLPEVIKLRQILIPTIKNNFNISSSMLNTVWMDELLNKYKNYNFIFVIEGVSMYFKYNVFKEFFANLASRFNGEIALDFLNTFAVKNSKKHDAMKNMQTKFSLGIDEPKIVENWADGIKLKDIGIMMNMYRKKWGFFGRLISFIPVFKNADRMCIYEINASKN